MDEATNILLQVIGNDKVIVEREGISVTYACKPLLIATFNPEEGEMRDHLLDRIGAFVVRRCRSLGIAQRAEAVDSVLTFAAGGEKRAKAEMKDMEAPTLYGLEFFAREEIGDVTLSRTSSSTFVKRPWGRLPGPPGRHLRRGSGEGPRPRRGKNRGRREDLKLAVKLAIVPSSFVADMEEPPDLDMPPPPPPPPPPRTRWTRSARTRTRTSSRAADQEDQEDQEDAPGPSPRPELPEEFMFDAEGALLILNY